ncbi:MAG: FMN-binding protein [Treponema sp.]|nr:FMN-binding protein [Treponema sp.]
MKQPPRGNVKDDFVMPITILPLICLFISGALAIGNQFTEPVIVSAAAGRAEAARKDILPHAEGFELMEIPGLPKTITGVYRTTNNVGYIFMTTTTGYGGEIRLICGIDLNGRIIKTATLAQTETSGLGTPIFEEPHAGQYRGKDKDEIEGIAAISGATISSNALKKGIRDSFMAFEMAREAK